MKAFLRHVKAFGRFWVALAIAVSATSLAAQPAKAGVPSDKLDKLSGSTRWGRSYTRVDSG